MRFFILMILLPFSLWAQSGSQASGTAQATPPTPTSGTSTSNAPAPLTLNQILFSEGDSSWTARDFRLYKKLVQVAVKKQRLAVHSDSDIEDFMASRLLLREAEQFDLRAVKIDYQYQAKGEWAEFSKTEVNNEIKNISLAMSLLELKEQQMTQKARFRAWIDVLKRKYALKIKAQDVVPAT